MGREHRAKDDADTGTTMDSEESNSDQAVQEAEHIAEEKDTRAAQGVKDLIREMNASCIGEQISSDEFLGYLNRLPRNPPWIDLDDKLEDTALDKQERLHALYRFRYLKHQFPDQTSKENLSDNELKRLLDRSEDDCSQKFLEEEGFLRRFEEDMTLDWFIHPDYEECSSLTDYQRLVLQNYGGTEYGRWSDYHQYLHSYKAEEEYVKYYEELSEKLKWMDDYIDIYCPSPEWGYITTRAAYQAIKIAATRFHEITPTLAYNGLNEFEESIAYDATWFKGYDELYFEIWQRVTQKSISFKDAIEEVCKLKMFPLRQRMMETALEHDYTMEWMEEEYQTCTKGIALGDTDKKAQKLIAEAVPTLVNKPKFYAQYITKKIEIARIIGILPQENDSEE
uniref:Uncharacterized protein n=1 Tax=Avena sativa TaxID=4498 RepID=A0ACD5TUS8_AVESA